MFIYIYICMYTYIYIYLDKYIYIYIDIQNIRFHMQTICLFGNKFLIEGQPQVVGWRPNPQQLPLKIWVACTPGSWTMPHPPLWHPGS